MSESQSPAMQYVENCQAVDHPDFPHYHYQTGPERLVFDVEFMDALVGRGAGDPDVHGYPGGEAS